MYVSIEFVCMYVCKYWICMYVCTYMFSEGRKEVCIWGWIHILIEETFELCPRSLLRTNLLVSHHLWVSNQPHTWSWLWLSCIRRRIMFLSVIVLVILAFFVATLFWSAMWVMCFHAYGHKFQSHASPWDALDFGSSSQWPEIKLVWFCPMWIHSWLHSDILHVTLLMGCNIGLTLIPGTYTTNCSENSACASLKFCFFFIVSLLDSCSVICYIDFVCIFLSQFVLTQTQDYT